VEVFGSGCFLELGLPQAHDGGGSGLSSGTRGLAVNKRLVLTDTRRVKTRTLPSRRAFRGVEVCGFDKGRVSAVQAWR
jgi:hypothetical protein